jgi:glycine cleavage system H protein
MNIQPDLKYTRDHEWVKVSDGVATVGISDYAQDALGDVVFVDLPGEGQTFAQGDEAVAVESTKAAASVYAAISGKVVEINPALVDDPSLVNSDCYGDGWMYRITVDDAAQLEGLMDAVAYEAYVGTLDD